MPKANEKLSVMRLALRVSTVAALHLAPKEDCTPNAGRLTQNCFIRRGWHVSAEQLG